MIGLIVIIIAFILLIILLYTNYITEYNSVKDDYDLRCMKLARECKRLEDENDNLRELRRQEIHNNTIIVNKNTELTKLLNEIADRVVVGPADSEKIVLAKIRELTHDYQSEVSSN